MKMTRLLTVFTALALVHTGLSEDLGGGRGRVTHRDAFELQPVDNDMTSDKVFQDNMNYRIALFKSLPSRTLVFAFLEYKDYPGWREELLTVHQDGDGYIAILTIPDQRLTGFTNDISQVSIRRIGKRLPPAIADRTAKVMWEMLQRVKHQEVPVEPAWETYSYFFMQGRAGFHSTGTPNLRALFLRMIMHNIKRYIESCPECEFENHTESKCIEYLLRQLEALEGTLEFTPPAQNSVGEIMAQIESYRAEQANAVQGKTPALPYSVAVDAQNRVWMSVTNMSVPEFVRLLNAELDKLKPRPYIIHLHDIARHDGDPSYWTNPSYVNIPADAKPFEDGAFKKLIQEKIVPTITLSVKDMPIQEVIRNIVKQHPAHIYGDVRVTHAHLAPNENRGKNIRHEWEVED